MLFTVLLRQTEIRQGVGQRFDAVNRTEMVAQENMTLLVVPLIPGLLGLRSCIMVEDAVLVNQRVALNVVDLVPSLAVSKFAMEVQDGHLLGHLENVPDEPDLVVVPFGQSCRDPVPDLSSFSDGQFAEGEREWSHLNRNARGYVLVEWDDVVVHHRRGMKVDASGLLTIRKEAAEPPNVSAVVSDFLVLLLLRLPPSLRPR